MNKITKRNLVVVFFLIFVFKIDAGNNVYGNDFTIEQSMVANMEELDFSVNYSDEIKCGEETTFTVIVEGGSGVFKYRIGNIMRVDDGEMNYVVDPSKLKYQDNNQLDFTFMASGTYRLDFYVMDMSTNKYVRKNLQLEINDPSYPTIEAMADQVVGRCLAEGNVTEYEKALWLHDWIIDNMSYDNSLIYCGAEGALARGKGTCESYHRGYAMLLKRVGIETIRMTGNGHLWTGVKLDGKWYHVDTTWDDPGYRDTNVDINHLYFGVTDEIITQVHSEYQPNSAYAAESIDNNYFVKNGQLQVWMDQYVNEIQQHLSTNDETFSINAKNVQWIESYKIVINSLVKQGLQEKIIQGEFTSGAIERVLVEYNSDIFTFHVLYKNSGWIMENGAYYYMEDGKRVTGWKNIEDKYYYFNENGIRQTGWIQEGSAKYYLNTDGVMMQNSWIDGCYYVKTDGRMAVSEWVDDGKYYVDSDGKYVPGKKQSGWKKDNKGWWYEKEDGSYPKKQWLQIDKRWYYFDLNGYMQTGWLKDGGAWYYLETSGEMVCNKWINNMYYVKQNGKMAISEWVDGDKYYVDNAGKYVPGKKQSGWRKDDKGWWYVKEDGSHPRKQWLQIDGKKYHFDVNGYMQTGWVKDGNTWYYLETSGEMAYSKWINNTYYVKSNGNMAVSEWVDSNKYYVDSNGKYVPGKVKQ